MDTVAERQGDDSRSESRQLVALLWPEYSYRHDLIWRLLFRVTAVAAVLSIAPFTIDDLVEQKVGGWVKLLPILALLLTLGSHFLLRMEYRLFLPLDEEYVKHQSIAVDRTMRASKRHDLFQWVVAYWFLALSLLVGVVNYLAWSL